MSGVALTSVMVEALNMAFVLPAAKCELNLSISEQGFINAVGFMGVILTSHFWGLVTDTWGRQKVLRLTLFACFISSAFSSISYSSEMLLVTRFIVGLL